MGGVRYRARSFVFAFYKFLRYTRFARCSIPFTSAVPLPVPLNRLFVSNSWIYDSIDFFR